MMSATGHAIAILLGPCLMWPPTGALALDTPAAASQDGIYGNALSAAELDRVRGGFETSAGLSISFGIERAVYVNGNLVTTTTFNLGELGRSSDASSWLPPGTVTLIQNGPGNLFQPGPVSPGTIPTVIQNTLDNQTIRGLTVINATVNSVELFNAMSLQSALRDAMTGSVRR